MLDEKMSLNINIIKYLLLCLAIAIFQSFSSNQFIYADINLQDKLTPKSLSSQLLLLLDPEEQQYIKNTQTLTVCSVTQAAGSDASINITKLVAGHAGLSFQASAPLSWQEALESLQNKVCDILPWATRTKERLNLMNFTEPYARITRVIVTHREQSFITDISLYDENIFVIQKGNIANALLKKRYPGIKFITAEHTSDALDMVANGKAFASIASLYSVSNLFNHKLLSQLKISGQLSSDFDDLTSFATRGDNKILNSILNKAVATSDKKAIQSFISEGALFTYDTGVDYSIIWKILAIAIILFSALIWWNRHLSGVKNATVASSFDDRHLDSDL